MYVKNTRKIKIIFLLEYFIIKEHLVIKRREEREREGEHERKISFIFSNNAKLTQRLVSPNACL